MTLKDSTCQYSETSAKHYNALCKKNRIQCQQLILEKFREKQYKTCYFNWTCSTGLMDTYLLA